MPSATACLSHQSGPGLRPGCWLRVGQTCQTNCKSRTNPRQGPRTWQGGVDVKTETLHCPCPTTGSQLAADQSCHNVADVSPCMAVYCTALCQSHGTTSCATCADVQKRPIITSVATDRHCCCPQTPAAINSLVNPCKSQLKRLKALSKVQLFVTTIRSCPLTTSSQSACPSRNTGPKAMSAQQLHPAVVQKTDTLAHRSHMPSIHRHPTARHHSLVPGW